MCKISKLLKSTDANIAEEIMEVVLAALQAATVNGEQTGIERAANTALDVAGDLDLPELSSGAYSAEAAIRKLLK